MTVAEFRVNDKIWRLSVAKGEMLFGHLGIDPWDREFIQRTATYAIVTLVDVKEFRISLNHAVTRARYDQIDIVLLDWSGREHIMFRDFLGVAGKRTADEDKTLEAGVATLVAAIRRLIDGPKS